MATKDRLAIALLLLVTVLVGGVLVDPLQSLPIPRPPVHDDDGNDDNCTAASLALHHMTTYQVILAYTNSSTCDNTVVFQLYNPAISVDAQCAAYGPTVGVSPTNRSSSSSSLAGDGWHSCFVESRDPRVAASFRFDFARREVTVNETWVCDDAGDGKQSILFQAFGTDALPAVCSNATAGGVFELQCTEDEDMPLDVSVSARSCQSC